MKSFLDKIDVNKIKSKEKKAYRSYVNLSAPLFWHVVSDYTFMATEKQEMVEIIYKVIEKLLPKFKRRRASLSCFAYVVARNVSFLYITNPEFKEEVNKPDLQIKYLQKHIPFNVVIDLEIFSKACLRYSFITQYEYEIILLRVRFGYTFSDIGRYFRKQKIKIRQTFRTAAEKFIDLDNHKGVKNEVMEKNAN